MITPHDEHAIEASIEIAPSINVSRETFERLCVFEELLRRWQSKINLISTSTLPAVWHRHFADSCQIVDLFPDVTSWADMGSGAGFPGMVMAIQIRKRSDGVIHLIESDAKKCAFLREVCRETSAKAEIHRARVEDVASELLVEGVTARALAPLKNLIDLAAPMRARGATCVFLKGQDVGAELTALDHHSRESATIWPSKSDPSGRIVVVQPTLNAFSRQV